jgi:hypothetical protein
VRLSELLPMIGSTAAGSRANLSCDGAVADDRVRSQG